MLIPLECTKLGRFVTLKSLVATNIIEANIKTEKTGQERYFGEISPGTVELKSPISKMCSVSGPT
jgi:hypothetical protein